MVTPLHNFLALVVGMTKQTWKSKKKKIVYFFVRISRRKKNFSSVTSWQIRGLASDFFCIVTIRVLFGHKIGAKKTYLVTII